MLPSAYIRGNMSGRQELVYTEQGGGAYDGQLNKLNPALNYSPRLIGYKHANGRNYFAVRTKSSVNLSERAKHNFALMGGSGALFASLIADKTSLIYTACMGAWSHSGTGSTFRSFIISRLRDGLAAKDEVITIAPSVFIVNPWMSTETPNVPVTNEIYNKFLGLLGVNITA